MPDMLVSSRLNEPLRGAAPHSAAAMANDRVQEVMAAHNKRGRRPLTPFEAKQLAEGEFNPIYIYNVSPIHRWQRPQGQLGTIVIPCRNYTQKQVYITGKAFPKSSGYAGRLPVSVAMPVRRDTR